MRKYILNENFFQDIDSEEKAYFLGFLFADGYVNEKFGYVDITINNKDIEILNLFVKHIYVNDRPLKSIRNEYVRLIINSNKIVNDLKYHGCFQKKTFGLKFPKTINKQYIRDFIRGYFDGDGCVTINNDSLNVSFIGTIDFLDELKLILNENCNTTNTLYCDRYPERNNNIRALRFGGNILLNRIYHFMYDDASIFLRRKKNIFLGILENKSYFCDKIYTRKAHQKYFEYNEKQYNKSELAEILSEKYSLNKLTVRSKLTKGWTIDEIISHKLNNRRISKLNSIFKYDCNGLFVEKYDSVKIAAEKNNCHYMSILHVVNKNKKLLKHYWKYE